MRSEAGSATEGVLSTGVPFLRLGQGPPLVVLAGLSPSHANPSGVVRRGIVSWMVPFAEHFTVYRVTRRPGLATGATMADIASDIAGAVERDIGEPVRLHGTSTGGSVALQLSLDRPELVQRTVLAAAACRLSPRGRQVQAQVGRSLEQGDVRRAAAQMFGSVAPRGLTRLARAAGWAAGGRFSADGLADMAITIAAEDAFDAEPRLAGVLAPTLVLGGTADAFYSTDLFRRTADGMPRGTAVVFPGKSHAHVAGSKVAAGVALGFLLGG